MPTLPPPILSTHPMCSFAFQPSIKCLLCTVPGPGVWGEWELVGETPASATLRSSRLGRLSLGEGGRAGSPLSAGLQLNSTMQPVRFLLNNAPLLGSDPPDSRRPEEVTCPPPQHTAWTRTPGQVHPGPSTWAPQSSLSGFRPAKPLHLLLPHTPWYQALLHCILWASCSTLVNFSFSPQVPFL